MAPLLAPATRAGRGFAEHAGVPRVRGGGLALAQLSFNLADPPEEPPSGVVLAILWRVAVRLYRDHGLPLPRPTPRCRQCLHPWPCSARRLAVLALLTAADAGVRSGASPARAARTPPGQGDRGS